MSNSNTREKRALIKVTSYLETNIADSPAPNKGMRKSQASLIGKLAEIDPALIGKPPKGFEVGYVPIVNQQGLEERLCCFL